MGTAWVAAHGITAADYQTTFDTLMPLNYRLQWVQAFGEAQGMRRLAHPCRRAVDVHRHAAACGLRPRLGREQRPQSVA
jgi:hypothetical protein